jgi:hypothetical protein
MGSTGIGIGNPNATAIRIGRERYADPAGLGDRPPYRLSRAEEAGAAAEP